MLRLLKARLGGEQGLAMPVVIGITSVMMLMIVAAVATSLGGLRQATNTENWSSALAAAYAGVEEYQSRLANDTTYMRFGNPEAPLSAESGSPDPVTLPVDTEANPAFGLGENGTWADVPGSDDAQFRYEVDNSDYINTGVIRLRSTGRVGTETRSVLADLRQDGFIDFLYFTDYEMQDPDLKGLSAAQKTTCKNYSYGTKARPPYVTSSGSARYSYSSSYTTCGDISFGDKDEINGPTHSNDAIRACQTQFNGLVTSAAPGAQTDQVLNQTSSRGSCTRASFGGIPNSPRQAASYPMPATNSQLTREVRADLASDGVPRPGCLFTGPTEITFKANGKMQVYSPWTRATQVIGSPATAGHANALCGTPGETGLGQVGGQEIDVPDNNIVYVQNVPRTAGNPNTWATDVLPPGIVCDVVTARDKRGNPTRWRYTNGIGYPLDDEVAPYPTGTQQSYGCTNGDLFVKGTVNGSMTAAAENYIYVTGDITYADSTDDVLGLISNNIIWVYNPVNSSGGKLLTDYNRRIDAAILSVQRTFTVQNHGKGGDRGTLEINGAIAQVFRGIVYSSDGSGSGGYTKEYNYDDRFKSIAPPRFLSPVTTTYGVTTWIEVDRAFNSDGSAR